MLLQVGLGVLVVTTGLAFYVTAVHLSIALVILSLCLLTWFEYAAGDGEGYGGAWKT